MSAALHILVRGAVQGVGFRPFVYRLAQTLGLSGWVLNDSDGVTIEIEGDADQVQHFLHQLQHTPPPRAQIDQIEATWHPPHGYTTFQIRPSLPRGMPTTLIPPDTATCPDCLAEMLDPLNRRFGYAFTNCTNCGPRFSIIAALPYDRPNTTMRAFVLCPACGAEYGDPVDRRFHAQPNACPVCGPRLAFDVVGEAQSPTTPPLNAALTALRQGQIVALKGIGGYQLLVDPRNAEAVARLRLRKHRPAKPLALMARDLEQAAALVQIDQVAAELLTSAAAPIVLLPRTPQPSIALADLVAPGHPYLGVMLPCSPLHHLLLRSFDGPLVATSGNLSDEPICIDDTEAHQRLGQIADAFLSHNRPIERHVDDSVVQVVAGIPRMLRRARGYAPLPVPLPATPPSTLALGGQLKNSIALSIGPQVFVSQHIGDLHTLEARSAFERVIHDFLRLYAAQPSLIAHDLHPDYASSQMAHTSTLLPDARRVAVQHHHAHFAACLAEHAAPGPALGVIWDGTGYGVDATIWGGEFLFGDVAASQRVAYLRPFTLPGGEAAVREPARVALALLWEILGPASLEQEDLAPLAHFNPTQRSLLLRMLQHGLNSPRTSSAGRLFDGVAALLGLHLQVSFEGQAAIALEHLADPHESLAYPFALEATTAPAQSAGGVTCVPNPIILDWRPAISALLADLRRGVAPQQIAARFHNGVISAICALARHIGVATIALSGGCFQNRHLAEGVIRQLQAAHHHPLLPRHLPVNDGGLCYGQVAAMLSTTN